VIKRVKFPSYINNFTKKKKIKDYKKRRFKLIQYPFQLQYLLINKLKYLPFLLELMNKQNSHLICINKNFKL